MSSDDTSQIMMDSSMNNLQMTSISEWLIKTKTSACALLEQISDTSTVGLESSETLLQSEKDDFKKEQDSFKQLIRELYVVEMDEQEEHKALKAQMHNPVLTQLMNSIEELTNTKSTVENDISSIEKNLLMQQNLLDKITLQCKQLVQEQPNKIKSTQKKMDFYNLFGFQFNYESVDEDKLCGFVMKSKQKKTVPFSLDTSSNSQFYITNLLWKLLLPGNE